MKLAALAALEQRTALHYTMPGMTAAETASYVAHYIKLVGRPDQLFTEDALNLIHSTARGFPRAVNSLSCKRWSPRSLQARTWSTSAPLARPSAKSSTNQVIHQMAALLAHARRVAQRQATVAHEAEALTACPEGATIDGSLSDSNPDERQDFLPFGYRRPRRPQPTPHDQAKHKEAVRCRARRSWV